MANTVPKHSATKRDDAKSEPQLCGIVMPIAAMVDYPESHWVDVLDILKEAVVEAGLDSNLVSYTEESSLIHTTIVQNLYDNPIVICDVSGKNPNVMFELGLRLAFDKPTIIIKDDKTGYSFDTGSIEHLTYPRDLRFSKIVDFKARLSEKIVATLTKAAADPNYSTFLKHFKRVTVAKLEEKEVTGQEFVLEELKSIRRQIQRMDRSPIELRKQSSSEKVSGITMYLGDLDDSQVEKLQAQIKANLFVRGVTIDRNDKGKMLTVDFNESVPQWVADDLFTLRKSYVS
jgi:hypothetical protein